MADGIEIGGPVGPVTGSEAPAREVLEVATLAARKAGGALLARFGGPAVRVEAKLGPTDLVSASDRLSEASIASVVAHHRPDDGILGEEGICDRGGTSGLRWVIEPPRRHGQLLVGHPAVVREHRVRGRGRHARGRCVRPLARRAVRRRSGRPATLNGAPIRRHERAPLAAMSVAGTVTCAGEAQAKRAARLDKRLYRRLGPRRCLGSAALELAWTAAGRLDVCYQEQRIHAWDVDAGLFICQRAGLRVHRLEALRSELAPRFLAAPAAVAGELLQLVGPPAKERREAAQRRPLSADAVRQALRRLPR